MASPRNEKQHGACACSEKSNSRFSMKAAHRLHVLSRGCDKRVIRTQRDLQNDTSVSSFRQLNARIITIVESSRYRCWCDSVILDVWRWANSPRSYIPSPIDTRFTYKGKHIDSMVSHFSQHLVAAIFAAPNSKVSFFFSCTCPRACIYMSLCIKTR